MKAVLEESFVLEVIDLLRASEPDAAAAIARLEESIAENPDTEHYQEAAKQHNLISEGTLEVDDGATVSASAADGAYVAAWIWVDEDDMLGVKNGRLV